MKKYIFIIALILIFWPYFNIGAVEQDIEKGAELYWQATNAVSNQDFTSAKEKYQEAAQYLSGKLQEDALGMAEFIGKMSSTITAKKLIASDPNFSVVGEVKEDDKIWHLYASEHDSSIMHVAIKGQKSLEDLVATIGQDMFIQKEVIRGTQGYFSKDLSFFPESVSRIRMWYCEEEDTTNIAYENFRGSSEQPTLIESRKLVMDETFMRAKCSRSQPASVLLSAIALVIILLIGLLIWRRSDLLKLLKKKA